jgi:hypothetical protein
MATDLLAKLRERVQRDRHDAIQAWGSATTELSEARRQGEIDALGRVLATIEELTYRNTTPGTAQPEPP